MESACGAVWIVEVAAIKLPPGAKPRLFHALVNPGIPIPAAATAVHGIGDADVAGRPHFGAIAGDLFRFLKGADLTGFNLVRYDLPVLAAEFGRAGYKFRLGGRAAVDVLDVYRRREPRDLASAVARYVGREHAYAHGAKADAKAVLEVLDAQVGRYTDLPATPAGLHEALVEVDVASRFRRDETGRVVFNFGKHMGATLERVAEADPTYLERMPTQDFLDDIRALVRRTLAAS